MGGKQTAVLKDKHMIAASKDRAHQNCYCTVVITSTLR